MSRKLIPGDWCRVNRRGKGLLMFGEANHFIRIHAIVSDGREVEGDYGDEYNAFDFYPRAALTFLFHEEIGHE